MSALAKSLFKLLREIDGEACARPDGTPTGIRWYCGHVNASMTLDETACVEDLWSQRLVSLLQTRGLNAVTQCHYPNSARRCDVVLWGTTGKRFWIEVKGEWREWIVRPGRVKPN